MVAAKDATTSLIEYMSQKLLDVAELNSVLDQFGNQEAIPSARYRTVIFNRHFDFGGFDFGDELPTRELSAADREALERSLPW